MISSRGRFLCFKDPVLAKPSRPVCFTPSPKQLHRYPHLDECRNLREEDDGMMSRRASLLVISAGILCLGVCRPSEASKLGPAVDQVWEQLGGGPSDLSFPSQFFGVWDVQSTLVSAEAPFGEDLIPDVFERAKSEMNQTLQYQVKFVKNARGQVVLDREFNTSEIMGVYMKDKNMLQGRIKWNLEDPNGLRVSIPGGLSIFTLVTRRSQEENADLQRLATSEYYRTVFDEAGGSPEPKVTGNRCFTKYKWRSDEDAAKSGGPSIVATQVVSEYLTASEGREMEVLRTMGKPIITYVYKLAFRRDDAEEGAL